MIKITVNKEQSAQWAKKTKGNLKAWAIETLQDINEEVVNNTPVITGMLRGSFWSSVGGGGDFVARQSPGTPDPAGAATIARLNLTLVDLELGDVYSVQNGANYAGFVEFGTVHMAPRAMVGRAVARFQAIADAAAIRVRSQSGD